MTAAAAPLPASDSQRYFVTATARADAARLGAIQSNGGLIGGAKRRQQKRAKRQNSQKLCADAAGARARPGVDWGGRKEANLNSRLRFSEQ